MPSVEVDLIAKINDRTARVAVIGLGYVGLPLVLEFHRQGFSVTGFDVDADKVTALNAGRSYIYHIPEAEIQALVHSGRFRAEVDFSSLRSQDAILICVPTPLSETLEPDLQYVQQTAQAIALQLKAGQLIILESTTYPGTTAEVVLPILESAGLKCSPGDDVASPDFMLAFSPERIDPGNAKFHSPPFRKSWAVSTRPAALRPPRSMVPWFRR